MKSHANRSTLTHLEKTEFLVVSAKTQKPTVNERLAVISPEIVGEGPPAPDWNQIQEWSIAALEISAEDVRQTDRSHRKSRVRLQQARQDRDARIGRMGSAHRTLRKSFTGTYGAESLPLVGLDAVPARALLSVREQMREVVVRMRDPQLASKLPEPLAGQQPIELEAVALARDAEIGELEAKMGDIDELRKQTDEALIVRDQAQAKNRRIYSNVGRLLEGVYRLAGLDELADRIRATQRAARKQAAGEPAAPEAEQDPPAPEPAQPAAVTPAAEGGQAT